MPTGLPRWTIPAAFVCLVVLLRAAPAEEPPRDSDASLTTGRPAPQAGKNYDQWTEAKRGTRATPVSAVHAPDGFQVEMLRSAQPGENSWVSMTLDPQGRVLIAKEGTNEGTERGILRLTLPKENDGQVQIESIDETLQECRGLLCAFDSLYARCNKESPGRPTGLYRLRDTNANDRYDEVTLLRAEPGGGHGVNDLTLGPDNRLYLIQGDQSGLPADWRPANSRVAHCGFDQLFGDLGSNSNSRPTFHRPPPGYLVRTDADGKTWEVLAAGLRNPFGIDFNPDDEAFTYEADMELDVGLPWYRPTHLVHLVSGVDYGWREGTGPWPFYYPERPPVTLPIGLGSPTAVKFGTRSHFPPRYRRALFILDWAYGRILAVHMTPRGASYECSQENFLDGRPLNVTDLEFGPDGAMYFITGGRQTQSGLYRVRYVGPELREEPATAAEQANLEQAAAARALRRHLELFHGREDSTAITVAWPHLASADPWIRNAARVAIESQPLAGWQERALAETEPATALTALLALARCGTQEVEPTLLARLAAIAWEPLDEQQKLTLLRTYELALIRLGEPQPNEIARIVAKLSDAYPAKCVPLDRELSQLLVYLHAPGVVAKTVPLAARAEASEDAIYFLQVLRGVPDGWSRDDTLAYFQTLARMKAGRGGRQYPQYLRFIETEAMSRLSAGERLLVAPIVKPAVPATAPLPSRPFVKAWAAADLQGLDAVDKGRNFQRGEAAFAAALCSQCHQVGSTGSLVGPDLTSVGRRFSRQDILRSIVDPSAVVDEKYRDTIVTTTDGRTVAGTLIEENDRALILSLNPLAAETATIDKADIDERRLSPMSPMPVGLLNSLSEEEIFDLLAYLESGGDPDYRGFRP